MKTTLLPIVGALLLTLAPRMESTYSTRTYAQQDTEQKLKTFSGTILKNGDKFILSERASDLHPYIRAEAYMIF